MTDAIRSAKTESIIPELEPHCGSWVATCANGSKAFETFNRATAERAAAAGWEVITTAQWLRRIHRMAQDGRI